MKEKDLPYSKEIMKHFLHPHNMGEMKNPDGIGKVGNIICVSPRVKIWTNNELIPINQLTQEFFVLSHDGRYHPITRSFSRNYKGKLIMIKNRLGKVWVTPEHLILAKKIPKTQHFLRTKNKIKLPSGWYHAKELEKGDILLYPILQEEKDRNKIPLKVKKFKYDFRSKSLPSFIRVDERFLRLAGYYLAEGHSNTEITRSFITFTLSIKEEEIAKDIKNIVKNLFNLDVKIRYEKRRKTIIVFIYSSLLSRFFKKLFGDRAENKHIPHFIMVLPKEKQKSLIYGLWKGDGYINLKRKNPRAGFTTISYQLAQQLKLLLLRQGIVLSFYTEREKTKKGVHHRPVYRIHIGNKDSLIKLCRILDINWKSNKRIQRKSWIGGGYLFTPITEIKYIDYKGVVNNIEVESTKSFVSDSVTLHNCGDVMWLFIKVKKDKKTGKEKISDIKFKTFGCVTAIASSSMITDLAKGKTLEEALKITNKDVIEGLGGKVPPVKIHCSVLAADALAEAIYDYLKKKKRPVPKSLEEKHERVQATLKQAEKMHKEYMKFEEEILKKR